MTNQIESLAVSVASKIAEGTEGLAKDSNAVLCTQPYLASKLNLLNDPKPLAQEAKETLAMLQGLIATIRKRIVTS